MNTKQKLPTFKEIHKLIEENYDAPRHLKPDLKELMEENGDFVFIRDEETDDKKLIGISFYQGITTHLVRTFRTVVHKKYRKRGIAKKLNDLLEDTFKTKGYKKIVCYIYTDNFPSIFLKLKRGYLIEGLHRNHDYEKIHEYTVSKEL